MLNTFKMLTYLYSRITTVQLWPVLRRRHAKSMKLPSEYDFDSWLNLGVAKAALPKLARGTAKRWVHERNSDRRTWRQTTCKLGRPLTISDEKVIKMIEWMTGHFDWRSMPLQEIAHIHGIKACDNTILAAFERHGYHHYMPDCKPFLSESAKKKRYAFSIANLDRPKEYWRKGIYYDESTIQSNMR